MLGQPHRVVAAAIHDFDALQRAFIDGGHRHAPVGPTEKLQDSELHAYTE
jgi:hypothetical protein